MKACNPNANRKGMDFGLKRSAVSPKRVVQFVIPISAVLVNDLFEDGLQYFLFVDSANPFA